MSMDGLWIGQVAMAALMNVAFAFAVGSALLGAWLAKDAQVKIAPARPAWLRAQRSMLTATVVLVLADLGWLLYQAASMSGVALPSAIGVVPTVLTQTHVGYGWSVAFAGALVLLGTAMASHTGMLRNALLWLAVIAIAAGKASLGHAADAGPGRRRQSACRRCMCWSRASGVGWRWRRGSRYCPRSARRPPAGC
jgi:Putative copper export protein